MNIIEKIKRKSKNKGLKSFIIAVITLSFLLFTLNYLGAFDKINFKVFHNSKDNIGTNNIDSLKLFDNIIYDKGVIAGNLVKVEFIKKSDKLGSVINIPDDKMWTPLFFEYKDLGNNYMLKVPQILTKRNDNKRVGRTYYDRNIYDDISTNTWWEKGSGFYFPEKKDFKSIKLSTRNRKTISGKNAIYVKGYENNVNYTFYFFEESLR